jgi:hypothetical protein
VHRGEGYSYEPQLFTDARGVRHVVWREGDRALRSDRVLYATSADARTWSAPREVRSAVPLQRVDAPRLAADGSGLVLTFAGVAAPSAAGPGGARQFRVRLTGADSLAAVPLFPDLPPSAGRMETTAAGGEVHAVWKAADGGYRHGVL